MQHLFLKTNAVSLPLNYIIQLAWNRSYNCHVYSDLGVCTLYLSNYACLDCICQLLESGATSSIDSIDIFILHTYKLAY